MKHTVSKEEVTRLRSLAKRQAELAALPAIRSTLDATAGKALNLEFVVRDVYTLHGDVGKARRAVELARQEIDRRFGALS
jgi:hypothetical protein